jgi:hypothetical protein
MVLFRAQLPQHLKKNTAVTKANEEFDNICVFQMEYEHRAWCYPMGRPHSKKLHNM